MSLYKSYKTDAKKELEGAWCTLADGSRFLIARACKSNIDYAKALERETRPYRRLIDNGSLDAKIVEKINKKVFLDTQLKGWDETVTDENDVPIQFSRAAAEKIFEDLPDVYTELFQFSQNMMNYLEMKLEEEAKN